MNMTTHVAVRCCVLLRGMTADCGAAAARPAAEKCPNTGAAVGCMLLQASPLPLQRHRESLGAACSRESGDQRVSTRSGAENRIL